MTAQIQTNVSPTPQVSVLHYHRLSKMLDVRFADGQLFQLSAEFCGCFRLRLKCVVMASRNWSAIKKLSPSAR